MSYSKNLNVVSKNKIQEEKDSVHGMTMGFSSQSKKKRVFSTNPQFCDLPKQSNEVSVGELSSLFKNPKQFMWLFGVELEYHLPPKNFITWPYMIKVVKGEKKLIKTFDVTLTTQLPRFEQLSIKRIWPAYKHRKEIVKYMPLLSNDGLRS